MCKSSLFLFFESRWQNLTLCRLKALIDNVMPSVMDKYMKECQKVADEK